MPRNSTEIGQRRHYEWEGRHYPSVTTILKAYPKEWLGAWAAKVTAETAVGKRDELDERIRRDGTEDAVRWLKRSPWARRDAAADRGSAVHDAAEHGTDIADVPENARARYSAYLGWLALYRPRIRVREGQVFNTALGYAGSFDLIADLYGKTYLIDIKTGTTGADVRLQLAAYRHGEFVGRDDAVDEAATEALEEARWDGGAAVLKLTDEGFQFIETEAGSETFRVFEHVKSVYDYWNTYDKEGVGGTLILPQTEVA